MITKENKLGIADNAEHTYWILPPLEVKNSKDRNSDEDTDFTIDQALCGSISFLRGAKAGDKLVLVYEHSLDTQRMHFCTEKEVSELTASVKFCMRITKTVLKAKVWTITCLIANYMGAIRISWDGIKNWICYNSSSDKVLFSNIDIFYGTITDFNKMWKLNNLSIEHSITDNVMKCALSEHRAIIKRLNAVKDHNVVDDWDFIQAAEVYGRAPSVQINMVGGWQKNYEIDCGIATVADVHIQDYEYNDIESVSFEHCNLHRLSVTAVCNDYIEVVVPAKTESTCDVIVSSHITPVIKGGSTVRINFTGMAGRNYPTLRLDGVEKMDNCFVTSGMDTFQLDLSCGMDGLKSIEREAIDTNVWKIRLPEGFETYDNGVTYGYRIEDFIANKEFKLLDLSETYNIGRLVLPPLDNCGAIIFPESDGEIVIDELDMYINDLTKLVGMSHKDIEEKVTTRRNISGLYEVPGLGLEGILMIRVYKDPSDFDRIAR